MKKPLINFVVSLIIGLGLGYIAFDVIGLDGSKGEVVATTNEQETPDNTSEETQPVKEEATETTATAGEGAILEAKGCIGCHAVSGLGLDGGATGPDLSQAFNNVEGKHGKALEEFLKEPTSAVMSTVIGGNPLTDEEIAQIVEALKKAAE